VRTVWSGNSSNEVDFHLQRRQRDPDNTRGTWGNVTRPPANATSHGDTGLAQETTYQYRIRACNGNTCSAWSNEVLVTTPRWTLLPCRR
jgi:hypothetical protein